MLISDQIENLPPIFSSKLIRFLSRNPLLIASSGFDVTQKKFSKIFDLSISFKHQLLASIKLFKISIVFIDFEETIKIVSF